MRTAALALLLAAGPLAAQAPGAAPAPAPSPTAAPTPAATVRVTITTTAGPIVLALEKQRAPITTANFLRYVDQKRLDGIVFYRAAKTGEGFGFVQFGVQNAPKRVLPAIRHEPTSVTGLTHTEGTISMAMATPGTAQGDFFITLGDLSQMDAKGTDVGFAAFGKVVEGMDLVRRILDYPKSPTLGVGVMKGQMLSPTLRILTVRRSG